MLSALFSQPQNSINTTVWGPWGDEDKTTSTGVRVTRENASQLLAVYGSASLITDQVSTTPVEVYGADRPRWVDEPTGGLDRVAWMSQVAWSILLDGNAYFDVLERRGEVLALEPLDPTRCEPALVSGRRVVKVDGVVRPSVEHIPGRMLPGSLKGMSPVEYARQSIGLGLAAQRYGSDFFEGPGNMDGVIELPGDAQPETMSNLAKQWRRKRRDGGRGLPGVLKGGAQWKATGVTNEQAQFLSTRAYTSAEIAGQMFLLDPSDLGIPVEGSSLTYANLQQRDVRRTKIALLPLVRRIEPVMSRLLTPGGKYRFDLDAHLRGNTKESYETLAIALVNGFMTIDEVREILGLPPRPDQTEVPTARELAEMIQKIYLGVGVVLTADEARDILNSGGANLTGSYEPSGTPRSTE